MNGGISKDLLFRLMVLLTMLHDTKTVDDAEDVVGMTRDGIEEIEKDIMTPENEPLVKQYNDNPNIFTSIQNEYKYTDFNKSKIANEINRINKLIKLERIAQSSHIRSSQRHNRIVPHKLQQRNLMRPR